MKSLNDLENEYGVTIIPSRITGRRWSFVGKAGFDMPPCSSVKTPCGSGRGFVVYGWEKLGEEQRVRLGELLRSGDEYC